MSYQFRPGQKVQFIGSGSASGNIRTGDIGEFVQYNPSSHNPIEALVLAGIHRAGKHKVVASEFHGKRFLCVDTELRPVDDGSEPGHWDQCVWKPVKEEA